MAESITNNQDDSLNKEDMVVYTKSTEGNRFIIYIDTDIDYANNYRKAFNVLRDATEKDIITIIFNTYGGILDTALQFRRYILNCKAKVIGELYIAYSAGSIILFSCDEIICDNFCSIMIHSMSFESFGKASEQKVQSDFMEEKNKDLLINIYKGFLNKEEIQEVLKGEDLWLNYSKIKEKLKKWTPIKNKIIKNAKTK